MRYFVAALISLFTIQSTEYDLGLNLKVGDIYKQVITIEQAISQEIMGQTIDINNDIEISTSYEVERMEKGNFVMKTAFTYMGMDMRTPMANVSITSEGDDDASAIFKSMMNKPFYAHMNRRGDIVDVEGLSDLVASVAGSGALSEEELSASFGEEAMKRNMQMAAALYPEKKVKVGEKWQKTVTVDSDMVMVMDIEYTLKSTSSDYFVVGAEGSIVVPNDKPSNVNGIPTIYNLAGTLSGEIKIDTKTRWVIDGELTQEIKGEVEMKASANMPQDITFPMNLKQKIYFKD